MSATMRCAGSRCCASAALAAALLLPAASAAEVDAELAARLKGALPAQRFAVIVRLAAQPQAAQVRVAVAEGKGSPGARIRAALQAHAQATQGPLLQALQQRKVPSVQSLIMVNAVAAPLTADDIKALAAREDVALIEPDIALRAPMSRASAASANCQTGRASPKLRLQRGCTPHDTAPALHPAVRFDAAAPVHPQVAQAGAPAAWQQGITGRGITVAVVDSGLDAGNASIAANLRQGAGAWFDAHGEHARPTDLHGHGTQVASLVVGTHASGATLGVAPQAMLMGVRIYDDAHIGHLSDIHRALAWLLDPDGDDSTADAPQIVLNAWGLTDRPGRCSDSFASDLTWLRMAGMQVVFAAGNAGPAAHSSISPANNTGALAVGALAPDGAEARFSSRGPSACDGRAYPDVAVRGMDLRVADRSPGGVPSYATVDGSSFAAAIVAGQLALIAQAQPGASIEAREALLRSNVANGKLAWPGAIAAEPMAAKR